MKKAVLILSLILMLIVLVQSVLVGVGGVMFDDVTLARGGFFGRIVALCFGLGAAFILGLPRVTMIIFGVAGLAGIVSGLVTGFHDLILWAVLALALGVMSYFAAREVEIPTADEPVRTASQF